MALLTRSQSTPTSLWRLFIEIAGLQTARGRLLFFLIVTLAVAIVPYAWLGNLSLWQLLGIPSPSIGLTRAYWKILHGDPVGAFMRNPLIYVVLAVGLPLLIIDIRTYLRARATTQTSRERPPAPTA